MKNFNIKKIKLKSKNEPSLEKKLTGEVISEIKSPMVEPNAELEGEEVLQFPDGVMHTVKGNPHSKGGVKMNIPDGTRILSKVLTLTKKNVADAKELYDVALTTKDSFAKAQEKFEKKIGLKRLFDEQEQMIKTLKTELEKKNVPEATFRLNQQYISEKINEIEEMKQSKEGVRADFFDFIFNAQEESKEKDKKNMPKKGEMKYGGIFNKFQVGGEMPSKYMPITSGMETAFIPLSRDGYQEPVISPVETFCPEGYEWDSNSQSCVPVQPVQNFDGNNINVFQRGGTVMIDYEAAMNEANTYGGLSKEKFDKLRSKYGLTEDQALQMINIKKFREGGKKEDKKTAPKKYTKEQLPENAVINDKGKNYKIGEFVLQPDGTYLKVTKINIKPTATADTKTSQKGLQSWMNESDENKSIVEQANAIIEKGIKEGTIVKDGKEGIRIRGNFNPDFREKVILSQVINQSGSRFGTDKYKIVSQSGTENYSNRGDKGLGYGSFVAGLTPEDYEKRFALEKMRGEGMSQEDAFKALDEMYQDPEKKKALRKDYIEFLGIDSPENEDELLSDNFYKNNYSEVTRGIEERLQTSGYRPKMGNDALSGFEHFDAFGFTANPLYEEEEIKTKKDPNEKKIEDDINVGKPKLPTMYNVPTYYPLPPTPLQAHMFPESRFGLIDPVRIGIEQQIQTSGESMKLAADQLQGLPPQQRAIVIAQMQADRQRQLNEEAYKANVTNAQNLSQTELFNIGQRVKQSEADIRNKLNFEQRQYTAMANTEEDLRRYMDRLNDLAMNRTMVNQNLNLINELADDFKLAQNMSQAEYDPSYQFKIRATNPYAQLFGNPYVQ